MTEVRVSFVRTLEPIVDHDGETAELEFATEPQSSSGHLLVPQSERYLAIPIRMLRSAGTNRVTFRGHVPWPTYRQLFDRPHPRSRKVKAEYRRRTRARGRGRS